MPHPDHQPHRIDPRSTGGQLLRLAQVADHLGLSTVTMFGAFCYIVGDSPNLPAVIRSDASIAEVAAELDRAILTATDPRIRFRVADGVHVVELGADLFAIRLDPGGVLSTARWSSEADALHAYRQGDVEFGALR